MSVQKPRPPKAELTLNTAVEFTKYLRELKKAPRSPQPSPSPTLAKILDSRSLTPKGQRLPPSSKKGLEVLHYLKVEECAKCEQAPNFEEVVKKLQLQKKKLRKRLREKDLELQSLSLKVSQKDHELAAVTNQHQAELEALRKQHQFASRTAKLQFKEKIQQLNSSAKSQKTVLSQKLNLLERAVTNATPSHLHKLCNDLLSAFKLVEEAHQDTVKQTELLGQQIQNIHQQVTQQVLQVYGALAELDDLVVALTTQQDPVLDGLLYEARPGPQLVNGWQQGFQVVLQSIATTTTRIQDVYAEYCGQCKVQ